MSLSPTEQSLQGTVPCFWETLTPGLGQHWKREALPVTVPRIVISYTLFSDSLCAIRREAWLHHLCKCSGEG